MCVSDKSVEINDECTLQSEHFLDGRKNGRDHEYVVQFQNCGKIEV